MLIGKDLEGNRMALNKVLSENLPRNIEENHKTPSIAGVLAEI
jgi:hypothetical protein